MEWQQIIGFFQVARLGSFTRAGQATFRTQSALSQQIKALEEEFGCTFFERAGTRKLKLTGPGERFMEFCEAVLSGYHDLTVDLDEIMGARKGRLRVAAPFTTLYHLFPERLSAYLKCFPQVEITLLDRPGSVVLELVRSGEIDFGLVSESIVRGDLVSIRWKRVDTVLMVPKGHPLVRLKRITWKNIAKYPLILPPRELQHAGRVMLEQRFATLGLKHRIAMESSNVELSSIYVEMGFGISLATVASGVPALKNRKLEFIPLDRLFKPSHIVLVMRKDKRIGIVGRAFMDILFGAQAWE